MNITEEVKEELLVCCFPNCETKFKYGNNANPLMDGRCCDFCNHKVLQYRISMFSKKKR